MKYGHVERKTVELTWLGTRWNLVNKPYYACLDTHPKVSHPNTNMKILIYNE